MSKFEKPIRIYFKVDIEYKNLFKQFCNTKYNPDIYKWYILVDCDDMFEVAKEASKIFNVDEIYAQHLGYKTKHSLSMVLKTINAKSIMQRVKILDAYNKQKIFNIKINNASPH